MFKKTKGKVLAVVMAAAMAMTVLPTGMVEADAAQKNKVAELPVSFLDVESLNEGKSYSYLQEFASCLKATYGEKYSAKMKLYVPTYFFNDKKASVAAYPEVSMFKKDSNGKYEYYATAEANDEEGIFFNASDVDKFEKDGDFYVLPVETTMSSFYDADGNELKVPSGEGSVNLSVQICGFKNKNVGNVYIDDASVSIDDKVVASEDFEDTKNGGYAVVAGDWDHGKTAKVVDYNNTLLKTASSSINVKKGKTSKIKLSGMYAVDKVSYKTSSKKVATVTSKGVVKGIKKGKAVITVKANGKTVKVKVTVK